MLCLFRLIVVLFSFYSQIYCTKKEKYIFQAFGDRRYILTEAKKIIIVRKKGEKSENYTPSDHIELLNVSGDLENGKFRIRFLDSGRFLCMKLNKKNAVGLCAEGDEDSLNIWDFKSYGKYFTFGSGDKCAKRAIKFLAKRKLRLRNCNGDSKEKWTFVHDGDFEDGNKPKQKEKDDKPDEDDKSVATVPDSVKKQSAFATNHPEDPPYSREVLREKLESATPMIPKRYDAANESSSEIESKKIKPALKKIIPGTGRKPVKDNVPSDGRNPVENPIPSGKYDQKDRKDSANKAEERKKAHKGKKSPFIHKLMSDLKDELLSGRKEKIFNPTSVVPPPDSDEMSSSDIGLIDTQRWGCLSKSTGKAIHSNNIYELTPFDEQ